jgi:ATP adenylyltransferase
LPESPPKFTEKERSSMRTTAELASRVAQAGARALADGALQPIASSCERVLDGGVNFVVRTTVSTEKPRAVSETLSQGPTGPQSPTANPFLPYHPAVFVADLSPSHVCLLNKFSVVPGHVLVVTRAFEPQAAPLTLDDFRAWFDCLRGLETEHGQSAVGFYNSGPLAGASQPHKHLQVVPYAACSPDDSPSPDDLPSPEPWPSMAALWETCEAPPASVASCAAWPLLHRLARLPELSATLAHSLYHRMLAELAPAAHNAILTPDWLVVVPRQRESFFSLGMNGLSYSGSILARTEEQRRRLLEAGPMAALRHGAFT